MVQNLIKGKRSIEAVFSEIENLVLESKHELKDRLRIDPGVKRIAFESSEISQMNREQSEGQKKERVSASVLSSVVGKELRSSKGQKIKEIYQPAGLQPNEQRFAESSQEISL